MLYVSDSKFATATAGEGIAPMVKPIGIPLSVESDPNSDGRGLYIGGILDVLIHEFDDDGSRACRKNVQVALRYCRIE